MLMIRSLISTHSLRIERRTSGIRVVARGALLAVDMAHATMACAFAMLRTRGLTAVTL
jgi:hypothetical protein